VWALLAIEQLQPQYFLPGFIRETITIESAATPASGLQQVGEIGFHVGRIPEFYDLFQYMGKPFIQQLRVLVGAAFQRIEDDFFVQHGAPPLFVPQA
jgi:hypothetical protein